MAPNMKQTSQGVSEEKPDIWNFLRRLKVASKA